MNANEIHAMIDEIKALRRDLFFELLDVHNAGGDTSELTAAINYIAESQHAIERFLQSHKQSREGNAMKIRVTRSELINRPLDWQRRGLQETRTGYGPRLKTRYMLRYAGRLRRIYCTCYSNSGTLFIIVRGERMIVDVD